MYYDNEMCYTPDDDDNYDPNRMKVKKPVKSRDYDAIENDEVNDDDLRGNYDD